jgi:hypothetical protein
LDRGREEKSKKSKVILWQREFKFAEIAKLSQQKKFAQIANQQIFQLAGKAWLSYLIQTAKLQKGLI